MHSRRTVLKGVAAGAVLGSTSLATGATASAAAGYHVAVVDQNSKTVRIYDRDATRWNDDSVIWTFEGKEPPLGKKWWADLSDVKIRKTAKRGLIALVVASGGGAGVVDIKKRGEHTDSDNDLIWDAYPDDNPHSIERIPYNGSILTASSKGEKNLQLYSPKNADSIDDFDGYEKVNSWTFPGAHGILWDPRTKDSVAEGVLWVLGDGKLVGYKVKGSGQNTDLDVWRTVPIEHDGAKMGHDLQPDYTHRGRLLLTDSKGVYSYDVNEDEVISKPIWAKGRVKSIARHPGTGEYVWVVGSPDTGEMGTKVSIGTKLGEPSDERGWADARFYKARIFSPDYE
ncbi:DUF6528 family protein [Saccharopolyspora sp. NFXS83]|uniref:DUF6528 family protein n=1 Tax=Saccharopolyspora sp. NFXS83 TaxID=2993560 RepID=UPI00224AA933|nr:DUF6528 family protein [Saccharopolyspora sp. NFXS83]MCX2730191.1 DUF6528 family protein [Saccharopolyspora sp. NFXS83]